MSQTNGKTDSPTPGMSARQICEHMAENGELLELLSYLEHRAGEGLLQTSLPIISRCVNRRAEMDPAGLIDDLFVRILSFGGLLMLKSQMVVSFRLRECREHGGHMLTELPRDLRETWIGRIEDQARFIAEMASARGRTRHVDKLNDTGPKRKRNRSRSEPDAAVDTGRTQAPGGAKPSGNGRLREPAPSLQRA